MIETKRHRLPFSILGFSAKSVSEAFSGRGTGYHHRLLHSRVSKSRSQIVLWLSQHDPIVLRRVN